MYCGKQEESAILAALGYGGVDVAWTEARWVGDADAAAMMPSSPSSSPIGSFFFDGTLGSLCGHMGFAFAPPSVVRVQVLYTP